MKEIKNLNKLLNTNDKRQLSNLFILTILISLIETIGISAIMPFITIASSPDTIDNKYFDLIYSFFNFSSTMDFVIAFGVALILFYLFRAIFFIFYTYKLNKFVFNSYHLFANKILTVYLKMPYVKFTNRNISLLKKVIITEALYLTNYIHNFLLLISEVFIIILLYSMLLWVDYKMTLVLTLIMVVKILILTKTVTKLIKKEGVKRNEYQNKFYKILDQTLANFKFIKLKGNKEDIFKEFSHTSQGFANTNIKNETYSILPKSFLETFGFVTLISIVIYLLIVENDATKVLPIISLYALALYRMLPALNRVISNYNRMVYLSKSLEMVEAELNQDVEEETTEIIEFNDKISLKNITFYYNKEKKILHDLDLHINKGDKIAVIGESGIGKSTLVDLIIGIYRPNQGSILIDGIELTDDNIHNWRKKIGYIPQAIYLFDGTVADNIAFGSSYDEYKVIETLKKVNMYDYFIQYAEGIDTKVGDGGIKLSGGQKQRLGIARALYDNPDILVLDEATSSLDDETEFDIMEEIYSLSLNKTLIIIAHRLSTIQKCTKIFDMNKIVKNKKC